MLSLALIWVIGSIIVNGPTIEVGRKVQPTPSLGQEGLLNWPVTESRLVWWGLTYLMVGTTAIGLIVGWLVAYDLVRDAGRDTTDLCNQMFVAFVAMAGLSIAVASTLGGDSGDHDRQCRWLSVAVRLLSIGAVMIIVIAALKGCARSFFVPYADRGIVPDDLPGIKLRVFWLARAVGWTFDLLAVTAGPGVMLFVAAMASLVRPKIRHRRGERANQNGPPQFGRTL
ncbi:MAG: hypothetical protein P4L84_11255 [Isosphaeraceae bacterium]|nr:hypothetical protein [Isosphaeraceae bacterium]